MGTGSTGLPALHCLSVGLLLVAQPTGILGRVPVGCFAPRCGIAPGSAEFRTLSAVGSGRGLCGAEGFDGAGLGVEVAQEASADVVTEDEDRGVGDVVIDLGALFPAVDDTGSGEGL